MSETDDQEPQKERKQEESEEEDRPEVRLLGSTEINSVNKQLNLPIVMLGLDSRTTTLDCGQRRL